MAIEVNVGEINERVQAESAFVERLLGQVRNVIVGQSALLDRVLIGIVTGGHILLEGVPGLAKTLAVRSFAGAVDLEFRRLQFTPDLLPADLIGTMIFLPKEGTLAPRRGPIFANVILADEINRAPAKVQSALLEAMQERQVTIGERSHALPDPFLVLATQNPIEQEGTYPLPEAQVDRFMLKVVVGYPDKQDERRILDRMTSPDGEPRVTPVIRPEEIRRAREVVRGVYVDDRIKDYVVNLVDATRNPSAYGLDLAGLIRYGASPRATIFLVQAAKAHAFIRRRGFVTPEDVKAIGLDVLRHRVILSYEAEAEEVSAEDVVQRVFDTVEVP
jgi:MoxR-like ATPase